MSDSVDRSGEAERSWQVYRDQVAELSKAGRSLGSSPDADAILRRELVGRAPLAALLYLMTRGPDERATFLPELLVALTRGPTKLLLVVRDVIRCCPRSMLEQQMPSAMEPLLATGDDEAFYRISEVLVELQLSSALDRLVELARDHSDPDIRDLARRNEGIASDPQRWGRLVQEWPISEAD